MDGARLLTIQGLFITYFRGGEPGTKLLGPKPLLEAKFNVNFAFHFMHVLKCSYLVS